MKNTIQKIIILSIIIQFFSCVKNDEPTPPTIVYVEENPVKSYLAASGFSVLSSQTSITKFEKGFSFIPKVTGNVSQLVFKFPVNIEGFKYTIWDRATGLELIENFISKNDNDIEKTENINEFKLIKGKEYSLTVNTKNYTKYSKPDNSDAVFPINTPNFTITNSCSSMSSGTYPTTIYKDAYFGECGFIFKQTQ